MAIQKRVNEQRRNEIVIFIAETVEIIPRILLIGITCSDTQTLYAGTLDLSESRTAYETRHRIRRCVFHDICHTCRIWQRIEIRRE